MKDYEREEKNKDTVKEPEVEYMANPLVNEAEMAHFLGFNEDTTSIEDMETQLEAFFAEQREFHGDKPIPEGCISIEDAYRKSIKHLEELYAKKKSHIDA